MEFLRKHGFNLVLIGIALGFGALALGRSNGSCGITGLVESVTGGSAASGPAPAFAGQSLEGDTIQSGDYSGQVLVVNFWATWCPPCRREIPDFIAAQDAYADQGVQFIGVALDDAKSTVQQYAEEHGINYPNIFEGGREMTGQFGGVRAIPTTFIIGRDGQILDRHVGGMTRADLDEAIQAAL